MRNGPLFDEVHSNENTAICTDKYVTPVNNFFSPNINFEDELKL